MLYSYVKTLYPTDIDVHGSYQSLWLFWTYALFTTKRQKVFCLDTHSTRQINLVHRYITSLNEVKYKAHPHLLTVNYFHKKTPSLMFEWVLATPLINYLSVLTLTLNCYLSIFCSKKPLHWNPYNLICVNITLMFT